MGDLMVFNGTKTNDSMDYEWRDTIAGFIKHMAGKSPITEWRFLARKLTEQIHLLLGMEVHIVI